MSSVDKPWKQLERQVAKILESKRVLRKGDQVADVVGRHWCAECKYRASMSVYKWWRQATDNIKVHAKEEKRDLAPVLVVREKGKEALVVIRLRDWQEMSKKLELI